MHSVHSSSVFVLNIVKLKYFVVFDGLKIISMHNALFV